MTSAYTSESVGNDSRTVCESTFMSGGALSLPEICVSRAARQVKVFRTRQLLMESVTIPDESSRSSSPQSALAWKKCGMCMPASLPDAPSSDRSPSLHFSVHFALSFWSAADSASSRLFSATQSGACRCLAGFFAVRLVLGSRVCPQRKRAPSCMRC